MQYVGFWWRVLAYFIDYIILGVAFWVVMMPFGGGMTMETDMYGNSIPTMSPMINLFGLVGGWLYFSVLESSNWQGTVGKKLLGFKVTDEAGKKISFGRATGRFFSKILSGLILCIGYIMVAFTAKKQGLHDMIVKTVVIKA